MRSKTILSDGEIEEATRATEVVKSDIEITRVKRGVESAPGEEVRATVVKLSAVDALHDVRQVVTAKNSDRDSVLPVPSPEKEDLNCSKVNSCS